MWGRQAACQGAQSLTAKGRECIGSAMSYGRQEMRIGVDSSTLTRGNSQCVGVCRGSMTYPQSGWSCYHWPQGGWFIATGRLEPEQTALGQLTSLLFLPATRQVDNVLQDNHISHVPGCDCQFLSHSSKGLVTLHQSELQLDVDLTACIGFCQPHVLLPHCYK